MPKGGWTGACTSWIARSSERTNMQREPRGDPTTEALGRTRGGYSTKIHLRSERSGKPMVFILTEGQRHEQPILPSLMEHGAVKRAGRGRPRMRPDRVAEDKGYSRPTIRRYLKKRRIGVVIPTKGDETPDPTFDRAAYRERNVIEWLINRLKQFRRIATRYEKRAVNYRAMVTLACSLLWL
jgi:transposase